jgi:hypothetical protein
MTDNEIWTHCKSLGIQNFVDKYGRDLTEQQQAHTSWLHRFGVTSHTSHLFIPVFFLRKTQLVQQHWRPMAFLGFL